MNIACPMTNPPTTPANSTAWYVMEMSISRYPAATCTRYRNKICTRITLTAVAAEPPHSTYPAIAASCVATLHRRTLARYSTLVPMATVHARAQTISQGVVSAASR